MKAFGRRAILRLGRAPAGKQQTFGIKLADKLVDAVFVDWQTDPYICMGYSYVPANGVDLRAQIAQPIENVLFRAGEATHVTRPATVHGALESGLRAAREILEIYIQ